MSNGKVWRIDRIAKEVRRRLEYVQSKAGLRELILWANVPKPRRERLTIAERIRFKYWLYWKYGPECGYCHRYGDWRYLTIDHIQPVSKGGPLRDIQNMVLACKPCNEAKGDSWEDLTPSNMDVKAAKVQSTRHYTTKLKRK